MNLDQYDYYLVLDLEATCCDSRCDRTPGMVNFLVFTLDYRLTMPK